MSYRIVKSCQTTLLEGHVVFEVVLYDQIAQKNEVVHLDDKGLFTVLVEGIESLAENNDKVGLRLKECLTDLVCEQWERKSK